MFMKPTFPSGSIIYGHPQCGNMMLAPIDTELPGLVSVVYDRVITQLAYQTAQSGNADKKLIWRYNVKTNHKVKYDNSSSDPSTASYRLILTAYDTQAAYITDNIARYMAYKKYNLTPITSKIKIYYIEFMSRLGTYDQLENLIERVDEELSRPRNN